MFAVSAIAGVASLADELHQRLAAQPIRQRPGLRLVAPHEGCVNDETRLHSKVQGKLHRFNCVISTIRVAETIRLGHADHEVFRAHLR